MSSARRCQACQHPTRQTGCDAVSTVSSHISPCLQTPQDGPQVRSRCNGVIAVTTVCASARWPFRGSMTCLSSVVVLSAGKLGLVLELVRCLDRHDLTTPAGNLVKLLIEGAACYPCYEVRDNHAHYGLCTDTVRAQISASGTKHTRIWRSQVTCTDKRHVACDCTLLLLQKLSNTQALYRELSDDDSPWLLLARLLYGVNPCR